MLEEPDVLVVAFNRVIAKELQGEIDAELVKLGIERRPEIQNVHALCLRVIGEDLRLLLSDEREAMLYDVLGTYPAIGRRFPRYENAMQSLHDHEAGHRENVELWQVTQQWLDHHNAALINDLPRGFLIT